MEFPITVNEIKLAEGVRAIEPPWHGDLEPGMLVGVRPCGKEYGEKTYLAVYVGEVSTGVSAKLAKDTGTLELAFGNLHNPVMYVPELKKYIYGMESWWYAIESEEGLKHITDQDIQNQWYVKALQQIAEREKDNSDTEV